MFATMYLPALVMVACVVSAIPSERNPRDTYLDAYTDSHGSAVPQNSPPASVVYASSSYDTVSGGGGNYYQPGKHHPTSQTHGPVALSTSYSSPGPSYSSPAPSYGSPAPSYGSPAPSYGSPAPSYGSPAPSYGYPAPMYGSPAPVYGPPSPVYGAPASTYGNPLSAVASYLSHFDFREPPEDHDHDHDHDMEHNHAMSHGTPDRGLHSIPIHLALKILLKVVIFKMIVKFIAVICILLFLPKFEYKDPKDSDDNRSDMSAFLSGEYDESLESLTKLVLKNVGRNYNEDNTCKDSPSCKLTNLAQAVDKHYTLRRLANIFFDPVEPTT